MRLLYTSFGRFCRVQVFQCQHTRNGVGFIVKSDLRDKDPFHQDQHFAHLPLAVIAANQVSDGN